MTDAYATIKLLAMQQGAARDPPRRQPGQRATARAGTIRNQLQLVVDRFVCPHLDDGRGAAVPLELLGEIPTDFSVREAVQQRQLLLESMPGSPAAIAVAAIAGPDGARSGVGSARRAASPGAGFSRTISAP